jgi:AAA15 family ATPase/GTPase
MFLEFSVENFRSIADRQTLSFVAGKHRSEAAGEPAVDEPGFSGGKVLTSVVVYGANAAGKSNVIRALNAMMERVARSAEGGASQIDRFRLDAAWSTKPSRFELSFMKDEVRYQYGFALDGERVHEEWLLAYPKRAPQMWFERRPGKGKMDIRFGPHLRGEKVRIAEMTRPDALFLSVAAKLNHPQLSEIQKWLDSRIIANRSQGFGPLGTARALESEPRMKALVHGMLRSADLGIAGATVRRHEKIPDARSGAKFVVAASQKEEFFEILTEHRGADGNPVYFDMLDDESEGTMRFFELVRPLADTLSRGGLLAIDELDQSLHPLLVRRLLTLFHDPVVNPHRAQLFFNTHDTTLLDPKLFRRDQVWFVEKDQGGKTRLYSLLQYSPRKEEALQRGYLQGRYGAVPFIGDFRYPFRRGAEVAVEPLEPTA